VNDLALLPDGGIGEIALVGVAALLFTLALLSGRWPLWLIGYLAIFAALILALVAGWAHQPRPLGAGAPPPITAQPFAGSGVLDDATRSAELAVRTGSPS
jgi:hypothetical protein